MASTSAPGAGPLAAAEETPAHYALLVSIHGGDHTTLLTLASALHRRGVDVVEARLDRPVADRMTFEAVIAATPRQARTVEATVRNLVHATDARVVPCGSRTDDGFAHLPAGSRTDRP